MMFCNSFTNHRKELQKKMRMMFWNSITTSVKIITPFLTKGVGILSRLSGYQPKYMAFEPHGFSLL